MAEDAKIWMEWKKQLTAYVAWVNSQLKKKPGAHLVEDLRHDVRDGVALIDLIEVIAGERLTDVHSAPSTYAEMKENVDKVLQFMSLKKIRMHHITTREIVEGNLKAIMRLILALAAHYKPNSVRHSARATKQNITGIAQGAAAALTEARRNATRAGHRYRRRRQREESTDNQLSDSDTAQSHPRRGSGSRKTSSMSVTQHMSQQHQQQQQRHHHHYHHHHHHHPDPRMLGEGESPSAKSADFGGRAELEGASDSSPVSSHNTSPRASLYLSDPPSSMEGLLSVSHQGYRGGMMLTSCESDNAMGDSGYSEVCDSLKETHQMLFQLHELLLTGDNTENSRLTPSREVDDPNPKETIIILKGRLLHAEEVTESLRSDLNKVKKDCMELQGTKAGLQQRLKDQEGQLSSLKSDAMRLELEKEKLVSEIEALKKQLGDKEQVLADVKVSYVKQVEDKDKVIADIRKELLKRDQIINTLKEQVGQLEKDGIEADKSGTQLEATLSSHDQRLLLLIECLNRLASSDRSSSPKTSDLDAVKDRILQARSQMLAQSQPSSTIESLEDSIIKLLEKMHINGTNVGMSQSVAGSQQGKERTPATTSRRAPNVSQNWQRSGPRDTQKLSPRGRGQSGSPGRGSPARSSSSSSQGLSRGHQVSPRSSTAGHAINRSAPTPSKLGPRSQIPRPNVAGARTKTPSPTMADFQTSVIYYIEQSDKPQTCVIRKRLGEIRLRDLKSVIEDSNLYHYFFKALDPEYGTVKEELSNDDDILPGWEGRIVAWLEEESGTVC